MEFILVAKQSWSTASISICFVELRFLSAQVCLRKSFHVNGQDGMERRGKSAGVDQESGMIRLIRGTMRPLNPPSSCGRRDRSPQGRLSGKCRRKKASGSSREPRLSPTRIPQDFPDHDKPSLPCPWDTFSRGHERISPSPVARPSLVVVPKRIRLPWYSSTFTT